MSSIGGKTGSEDLRTLKTLPRWKMADLDFMMDLELDQIFSKTVIFPPLLRPSSLLMA